jgi:hypothetical protein
MLLLSGVGSEPRTESSSIYNRAAQPVAREQTVARDRVILLAETFKMKNYIFTLYLAKPR